MTARGCGWTGGKWSLSHQGLAQIEPTIARRGGDSRAGFRRRIRRLRWPGKRCGSDGRRLVCRAARRVCGGSAHKLGTTEQNKGVLVTIDSCWAPRLRCLQEGPPDQLHPPRRCCISFVYCPKFKGRCQGLIEKKRPLRVAPMRFGRARHAARKQLQCQTQDFYACISRSDKVRWRKPGERSSQPEA